MVKLPPTSESIVLHIKRAYLQCYRWIHSPFDKDVDLDPTDFGYVVDEDDNLAPKLVCDISTTPDFPTACTCLKCAKKNRLSMQSEENPVMRVLQVPWSVQKSFERNLLIILLSIVFDSV